MSLVYDAGVLIAADRNDPDVWAEHRSWLERGILPITTAPVVAQVSRSPRQAQLRRFLRGCAIEPFTQNGAHAVGALAGAARTDDVVDAQVVLVAAATSSTVVTSDPEDLQRLSDRLPNPVPIRSL